MSRRTGRFALLGLLAAFLGPIGAKAEVSRDLGPLLLSSDAKDALARVAYAEAGNQGDSGLAGVVFTVLNRLASGSWGGTLQEVVNARGQFEPVKRMGGDWRRLPEPNAIQRAHIDAILNLALDGRLPDLTNGALYFQNPVIVARRAAAGQVSARLVGFGAAKPVAIIGAHSFYVRIASRVGRRGGGSQPVPVKQADSPFVGRSSAWTAGPEPSNDADVRLQSSSMFIGRDLASTQP